MIRKLNEGMRFNFEICWMDEGIYPITDVLNIIEDSAHEMIHTEFDTAIYPYLSKNRQELNSFKRTIEEWERMGVESVQSFGMEAIPLWGNSKLKSRE